MHTRSDDSECPRTLHARLSSSPRTKRAGSPESYSTWLAAPRWCRAPVASVERRTGDLKYEAFERSEITVRTYGDAAIMTSRESTKAFYKGREVPGGDYRATHVFVRQEGRWRLAGIHLSPILPGI